MLVIAEDACLSLLGVILPLCSDATTLTAPAAAAASLERGPIGALAVISALVFTVFLSYELPPVAVTVRKGKLVKRARLWALFGEFTFVRPLIFLLPLLFPRPVPVEISVRQAESFLQQILTY
jgi:hypothetical protein